MSDVPRRDDSTAHGARPLDVSLVRGVPVEPMAFAPRWTPGRLGPAEPPREGPRTFVVPPGQHRLHAELSERFPGDRVLRLDAAALAGLAAGGTAAGEHLVFATRTSWADGVRDEDVVAFLKLVHALDGRPAVRLDVFTDKAVPSPLFAAATHPADGVYVGLAQTLANERPDWSVRCFCLHDLTAAELARLLDRTLPTVVGKPVCIRGEDCATPAMGPVSLGGWPARSAFREGGTYVILGGNGGIGGLLAEYLAATYRAELVVVGRRPPERFAPLRDRLRELGARDVHYHRADLADEPALRRALGAHDVIHGVVHSALVLDDAALATMSEEVLCEVLRPKLHGAHHLLRALRGRDVDFCLFFSSVQSYLANAGQGNYAAACVAKDSYADLLRNALLIDAKVINWGFWGEVGVVAKPDYRKRMAEWGIGSIEPAEGLAAVERFLAGEHRQITFVKATEEALTRMGITPHEPAAPGILDELVPVHAGDDADAARNRDLAERLEAYTRWRLHQVVLPATTVPKYAKLRRAIDAVPPARSLPRADLVREHPELAGHLTLLDRCLEHLPEVLTGDVDALDVLFPDGEFDLVAPVYQSNPIADHFNRVVARVVARYQRHHAGRPLRILEVGAGTGSTTRFVLPELDPRDVEYRFTDLSYAFLHKARDGFGGDHPFVTYEICDIERPPEEYAGAFDVVVATNVLHATADVPATLRNVRGVLRDGGILVLNEITARQDFATLTFGLTDGWWLSHDAYRIENSPLLDGERWRALMGEAGFGAVRSHGGDGQQVMVALAGAAATAGTATAMSTSTAEAEAEAAPVATATATATAGDLPAAGAGASAGSGSGAGGRTTEDLRQAVEEFLRTVIADTMRFDLAEVEPDRPFRDMGIDSLIAMELLKPLRQRLGYLPATVLFEHPTLTRLTTHLLTDHTDTLHTTFATTPTPPPEPEPESGPAGPRGTAAGVAGGTVEEAGRRGGGHVPRAGDIAVVGMSARLPGARNAEEFWSNLFEGVDCTSAVPPERFSMRLTEGPGAVSYTERGAFVDDVDAFDHTFFGLTPNDAVRMDPQERLLLEQTYLAILDAGYSRARLAGSDTGVFVGVMNGGYAWHTVKEPGAAPPTSLFWSMANRASYHFDWHGPSMAVDTACSASLTALHLACQSLRAGECDRAVVGGVNLITHPRQYRLLSDLEMLSRGGQCRPFGEGADGFVDGEGVISLVLRPAEDAVRDGDRILAVVRGSAVNAGGRANGYTAPNPDAQFAVVTRALAAAGLSPEDVGYVEAHGTGTALGDPIELRALGKAYATAGTRSIRLGSVKSNIGHLESAAGLSGVLKALLQMRHGHLVASLHAERPNPHLDFAATPFRLCTEREAWPASLPLVSAVSSFGAGGANAHVVLRGVPEETGPPRTGPGRDRYVVPVSHHSGSGLLLALDDLRQWLTGRRVDMDALAHTLACRRDHFRHRVAFVCRDQGELLRALEEEPGRRRRPAPPTGRAVDELSADTAHEIAALYESGGSPDWDAHYARRAPLPLPEYRFLRHRHWTDSEESGFGGLSSLVAAHRIDGATMAPAAWTLSVLAARREGAAVANVLWQRRIDDPDTVEVRERDGELSLVDRVTGAVHCTAEPAAPAAVPAPAAGSVPPGARRLYGPDIYAAFRRLGYDYGAPLRGLRWAEVGPGAARAFVHVDHDWGYDLSPALLDSGMQLSVLLAAEDDPGAGVFVPYHLGRLTVVRAPRDEAVFCHCVARPGGASRRTRTYDFWFTDADGEVLVTLEEAVSVAVDGLRPPQPPAPEPAPFTVFELN